jgi:hypothetical protein
MLYSEKLSMLIYHNLTYKVWFLLDRIYGLSGNPQETRKKPASNPQ